jgi:peptidyl-prolyl cis-trans isomerase D
MLAVLRSGAKSGFVKYTLFGLLIVSFAGLAMMDVQGFFRSGGVRSTEVATMGGDPLPLQAFDPMVRNILQRQGLDVATAWQLGLIDRILDSEITNNVLMRSAKDLGIVIGDEAVAKQVAQIIAPSAQGQDPKAAFQRLLTMQGMTEQQFTGLLRGEMSNTLLKNAVQFAAAIPSKAEAQDLYQYQNEERAVSAVFLPDSAIAEVSESPDDVLKPLYDAGREKLFSVPETRTFTLASLKADTLKAQASVTDEEVKAEYDAKSESYKMDERRMIHQAVVKTQDEADKIATAVKGGESLIDAAKEAFIPDNAFEKKDLPQELADAVFAADKGATLPPIKTAMGYHVVQVNDILAPETVPFEKLKDGIKTEMLKKKAEDKVLEAANAIDEELSAGAPLEGIVEKLGMIVEKYPAVRADGSTEDNHEGLKGLDDKDKQSVVDAVFGLESGESSPMIELSDGRLAVVRADEVTAKHYKDFAAVKDDLRRQWESDQRAAQNKVKADDAVKALEAGEKKLDAVGTVKDYAALKRDTKPDAPLDQASLEAIFAMQKGEYAAIPVSGGMVVAQVVSTTLPDVAKADEKTLQPIETATMNDFQIESLMSYINWLRGQYNVTINDALLLATYGPGNENQP